MTWNVVCQCLSGLTWPRLGGKLLLLVMLVAITVACQPLLVDPSLGEGTIPAEAAPIQGAPGLDDPLYPLLGNGGYDVQHYQLELTVDPATNTLTGTAILTATALADLATFNLDLLGLTVTALTINGESAVHERTGQEMTLIPAAPLAARQNFTVAISYGGNPQAVVDPGVPFTGVGWLYYADVGSYVLSEPSGAMGWFPNNNHPTDKATYSFHVTVPADYMVAANGLLQTIIERGDWHTYHWEATDPMASYLATVNVARFEMVQETGPADLPIINFFPPEQSQRLQRKFAVTNEMLDYFSSAIAPYPFESYGAIVMDAALGGALETQTRSIFGRSATVDLIIAHELAHQWFGNHISPATWRDLWLNEGFATYFQHLWTEHSKGKTIFDATMRGMHVAIRSQQLPPPADPPLDDLFGPSVYIRGAITLHALRLTVGDDVFWEIVQTYYARHQGGNASTADFIAVAETVSGEDLTDFFQAWLYAAEIPELPGQPEGNAAP